MTNATAEVHPSWRSDARADHVNKNGEAGRQAHTEFGLNFPDAYLLALKAAKQEKPLTAFEKALLGAYREFIKHKAKLSNEEIKSAAYLRAKDSGTNPKLGQLDDGQREYLNLIVAKATNQREYQKLIAKRKALHTPVKTKKKQPS